MTQSQEMSLNKRIAEQVLPQIIGRKEASITQILKGKKLGRTH